ncbi:MAG: hypothetical protein H5T69_06560 [Chloroflexi bacterium]|nr:hypothetical protein [Chloroflexota bacterium]
MPIVCGVQFRGGCKIYYFSPGEFQDLEVDDYVIVETSRGQELGRVVLPIQEVSDEEVVGELKPILRRATTIDLLDAQRYRQQENEAVEKCKEQVNQLNLPMKIVGAEYSYDGSRLTFFFTAEERVDFRQLVRELAHLFKTRIELRQIGVRDEAKMLGGVGKCGRHLCCASWLTDFRPVSIRMAKQQNLPLSPMEISGICGRLLCCLLYEDEYYGEVKSRFPKVGKIIETPYGPGKVVRVSVLKETVSILFEDGSTLEMDAEELAGGAPASREEADEARAILRRQKLEKALNATPAEPPKRAEKQDMPAQAPAVEATPARKTDRHSQPRRRRRRPQRVELVGGPSEEEVPSSGEEAHRRRSRARPVAEHSVEMDEQKIDESPARNRSKRRRPRKKKLSTGKS